MRTIGEYSELLSTREGASLVMFGGSQCSICSAVKPKLERLLASEFPLLDAVYINCEDSTTALCGQEGVFSIPVVQLWFEGRKHAEFIRSFSIAEVQAAISKPYQLIFG